VGETPPPFPGNPSHSGLVWEMPKAAPLPRATPRVPCRAWGSSPGSRGSCHRRTPPPSGNPRVGSRLGVAEPRPPGQLQGLGLGLGGGAKRSRSAATSKWSDAGGGADSYPSR